MQIVIRVRILIKQYHPYTKLREAAAIVRGSFNAEFRQLGADEIMNFIRGDEPANTSLLRDSH
jgi:hypothetical protein